MTELWPHLPDAVAGSLYADLIAGSELHSAPAHPEQVWAPVGGRVRTTRIQNAIGSVADVATKFGFPGVPTVEGRIGFDRAVAGTVREFMDLSWADAGNRGTWSFMSLVALPHITRWRFGTDNRERWIASDLTRHTWARLWWQAVVFEGHDELLAVLSESDLNQLLERRSIGGDPRLVTALAIAVVTVPPELGRRDVIRDVSKRLRRYLAFVDVRALDAAQLAELCRSLCGESVESLRTKDGIRQGAR